MELMTPFAMYLSMGHVPMHILHGVPELFCLMVVIAQAASCILAMMRHVIPVVLYKAAQEPAAQAAAA